MNYPASNRTYQILHNARRGGYAVGGYCVYNAEGVLAVIKAAERCQSPAVIQVFPWTMHSQGRYFCEFAANAARNASVPISLHLDHCLKPKDTELALTYPFDSIMVDGSMFDEQGNIDYVKSVVEKAKAKNICIEAEIGRMEGCEDGLPKLDLDAILTNPEAAKEFVQVTGVHFLAPSFGNVHGPYPPGGAEAHWQLDRLEKIHATLGDSCPLVLHGTHPCSDHMVKKAMSHGMIKINENRTVRKRYMKFLEEHAGKMELTDMHDRGVQIYSEEIERFMVEVAGSAGKA